MKFATDDLADNPEIKEILLLLEQLGGANESAVLEKFKHIRKTHLSQEEDDPFDILSMLINDYRTKVIDLNDLKRQVLGVLHEYHLENRIE